MPKLGEIKHGKDIDKYPENYKFMWVECPRCKFRRWTPTQRITDRSKWNPKKFPCRGCAGFFYQLGVYDAIEGWKDNRCAKSC